MSAFLHASPTASPQHILATVWQRNLPLIRQRVQSLRATAEATEAGCLAPAGKLEALEIAHKLAGSLGMFGYPRGSEVAHQMELLLDTESPLPATLFRELVTQLEQVLSF